MIRNDEYFAALSGEEYLDALVEKENKFRTYIKTSGKVAKWDRMMKNYYGVSADGMKSSAMVNRGGDQGQLTFVKCNDFRNLVQHMLILTTSQRPAGECKATSTDTEALHQCEIGSALMEYYLEQQRFEDRFVRACEVAVSVDESFVEIDWNAKAGTPVRPDMDPLSGMLSNNIIKTGDLEMRVHVPWRVAREVYVQNPSDCQWYILQYRMNKWDLAAKYPDQREKIIHSQSRKISEIALDFKESESDLIDVFCLVHDKTMALPLGRKTLFIPDAILEDSLSFGLPYPELNVYRMSQSDILESSFGYSNATDLLSLEELTDGLHSIIASNQFAFGGNVLVVPKGAGIIPQALGKALTVIEADPAMVEKIRTLELLRTAPEIFKYIELLDSKKEAFSGINSVIRGEPEGALKSNSGSALALIQAQALQFNSGLQRSYYSLLSRTCTGMIKLLQRYAQSNMVAKITGKVKSQYLQEFTWNAQTIDKISSVTFELVNPVEKSIGGKISMAENLLNAKMIESPKQYLNVIKTGNLETMTQDDDLKQMSILEENEALRDGSVPVQATLFEDHKEHIDSHSAIIASPQSKQDAQLVQRVTDHINDHMDKWEQLSESRPTLLIATDQQVLPIQPPQPPPGMMPPPQQMPPHQGPPAPQAGNPPPKGMERVPGPENPIQTEAQKVRQPNMPKNPATGERVPVPQH